MKIAEILTPRSNHPLALSAQPRADGINWPVVEGTRPMVGMQPWSAACGDCYRRR
jgi:hypothetical protein